MNNEIRREQHFAVSSNGVLLHINKAYESNDDFFCPHCGCHMIKRCGELRKWHFAHDWRNTNEFQKKCSYETYLHSYAKLRIKQWFDESHSIILHFQEQSECKSYLNCFWRRLSPKCKKTTEKSLNLRKYLNVCEIEKEIQLDDNIFRPDLLWYNNNHPQKNSIFIEIKVSHGCTKKKKLSGAKIIEFEVHSEEDINNIINNDIRENENIRYYGFNINTTKTEDIRPLHNLIKFTLFKSGKTFVETKCNCQIIENRRDSSIFELAINDIVTIDPGIFHNIGLAVAKYNGFNVRNCFICNKRNECIRKKIDEEKGSDAIDCELFQFNETYYSSLLSDFRSLSKKYNIYRWIRTP